MHDSELAEANARTALELESVQRGRAPKILLGDIAYEKERYVEATKHLESLVARASALPKDDAVRVLVRFVEAYGRTVAPPVSSALVGDRPPTTSIVESQPRLGSAVSILERLAPNDAQALARVARVLFECGDVHAAKRMYEAVLAIGQESLTETERADSVAARRVAPPLGGARQGCRSAPGGCRARIPRTPGPPALSRASTSKRGTGRSSPRIKGRRLELASGAERFGICMEIGDAEFKKLGYCARGKDLSGCA